MHINCIFFIYQQELILKSTIKYICCISHTRSSALDTLASKFLSAKIVVLGDFNIYSKNWLGPTTTDCQGRAVDSFVISNSVKKLVTEPTFLLESLLTNQFSRSFSQNPSWHKHLADLATYAAKKLG